MNLIFDPNSLINPVYLNLFQRSRARGPSSLNIVTREIRVRHYLRCLIFLLQFLSKLMVDKLRFQSPKSRFVEPYPLRQIPLAHLHYLIYFCYLIPHQKCTILTSPQEAVELPLHIHVSNHSRHLHSVLIWLWNLLSLFRTAILTHSLHNRKKSLSLCRFS